MLYLNRFEGRLNIPSLSLLSVKHAEYLTVVSKLNYILFIVYSFLKGIM